MKALVGIMYAQEVIAFDKMSEFLSILTDNILKVSHGSLLNWLSEISEKSLKAKKLKRAIRLCKVISTDLTITSFEASYSKKN